MPPRIRKPSHVHHQTPQHPPTDRIADGLQEARDTCDTYKKTPQGSSSRQASRELNRILYKAKVRWCESKVISKRKPTTNINAERCFSSKYCLYIKLFVWSERGNTNELWVKMFMGYLPSTDSRQIYDRTSSKIYVEARRHHFSPQDGICHLYLSSIHSYCYWSS